MNFFLSQVVLWTLDAASCLVMSVRRSSLSQPTWLCDVSYKFIHATFEQTASEQHTTFFS